MYRITSNIRRTLVGNTIVDPSALLQLHLHSRLNIWLQGIRQRQAHDSARIFEGLEFDASYIRDLTVFTISIIPPYITIQVIDFLLEEDTDLPILYSQ